VLTWLDVIRVLLFGLIALLLGLFGLSLFFSDLGPGETWTRRLVIAALLFFLSGLFIGYLNPKLWIIAGLTAWGPVLFGSTGLINILSGAVPSLGIVWVQVLAMLLLPLGLALLGAYVGALVGRKHLIRRLLDRILRQGQPR
jgi:hypothetical protein